MMASTSDMVAVRPLRWPADRSALLALDTSFVTDRVYQLVQTEQAFELKTVPVTPSIRKDYQFAREVDSLPAFDQVLVAEIDAVLTGVAALKVEAWNRRVVLWHFYVASAYRGRGVGRSLIDSVIEAAQMLDARCLWLETQHINYGAIQFYKQAGFQWCGLDTSLYDQQDNPMQEIALFFMRDLPRCSF